MTEIYVVLGALGLIGGLVAIAISMARQEGKMAERDQSSDELQIETKEAKNARDAMVAMPADDRRRWLQGWTRR